MGMWKDVLEGYFGRILGRIELEECSVCESLIAHVAHLVASSVGIFYLLTVLTFTRTLALNDKPLKVRCWY